MTRTSNPFTMAVVTTVAALTLSACTDHAPDNAAAFRPDAESATIDGDTTRFTAPEQPDPLEVQAMERATANERRSTAEMVDIAEPQQNEPQPDLSVETSDRSQAGGVVRRAAEQADRAVVTASSCRDLAAEVIKSYQVALDVMGPADRSDVAVVDQAYESLGDGGRLTERRAEEIGCTADEVAGPTCVGVGTLRAEGEAGQDLVDLLQVSC